MSNTANFGIVKPVSEHDAQKIATLNTEADDFDAVNGGMLLLDVSGAADITLTRSQALNRVLKFTGVLTGNIIIFLPVSLGTVRDPLVWNATSGAFTLTIKTTAGGSAGVAITQSKKVYVFHDGTDVYKATTEV